MSRQRQPSGRSNSYSSTTSVTPSRPLRLALIPEESTTSTSTSTSNKIEISNDLRRPDRVVNTGAGRTLQEGMESGRSSVRGDLASSRLSTYREVGAAFSDRPWRAPSVQNLTAQLGKTREAHALVVEGRHGDVLTAVGSDKDHTIANEVLSRAQEMERQRRQSRMPTRHAGRTPRHLPPSSRDATRSTPREFGVVYEHRDCFGKPQFVSHTGGVPEKSFSQDAKQHQGVRNLLTYQDGRSEVVWAGSAAISVGAGSSSLMQTITHGIVEKRAQDHQLEKLKGPKPYSRHGY